MAFTLAMSGSHFPPFQLAPAPTSARLTAAPPAVNPASPGWTVSKPPSAFVPTPDPPSSLPRKDFEPVHSRPKLPAFGKSPEIKSTVKRSFSTRSQDQHCTRMAPSNRDSLHINTFTSALDRDALFSRATSVAAILRSLGPSKDSREQGVEAVCAYVEGKKSKGKKDDEVRKKLALLERMVPTDLGDVFVKASIRSGLARRTTHSPPPLSHPQTRLPLPAPHRLQAQSRLSITTITSSSYSNSSSSSLSSTSTSFLYSAPSRSHNQDEMEPALPETPITQFTSFSDRSGHDESMSAPFDWSLSLSDSIGSGSSPASSSQIPMPSYDAVRRPELVPRAQTYPVAHSDTDSSFSAPEPEPYFTDTLVEYSSSISAASTDSDDLGPPRSLGRAPTLLSPLAIGGWGRQWEKPLLDRERSRVPVLSAAVAKGDSSKRMDAIDGISLESFPTPPERSPDALTPPDDKALRGYEWGDASPDSNLDLQSPWTQIQTPPAPHLSSGGGMGVRPAAPKSGLDQYQESDGEDIVSMTDEEQSRELSPSVAAGMKINSSWLSISDYEDVPLAKLAQAKGRPIPDSVPHWDTAIDMTIPAAHSQEGRPGCLSNEDDVPLSLLINQKQEDDDIPLARLYNGVTKSSLLENGQAHLWTDIGRSYATHSKTEMQWSRSDGQDWEWEFAGGYGSDEERTITGVESSRWSAVWSDISVNEASAQSEPVGDGSTEASRIRDAYLSMIKPRSKTVLYSCPPQSSFPEPRSGSEYHHGDHGQYVGHLPLLGPEQGDSHAILMAYAQPAPAPASA
ncbi:hypothetical protein IAU59_005240 [Kwoniella sp. CBS 9459]